MKNTKAFFIVTFILLSAAIFVLFDYKHNQELKSILEQRTSLVNLEFNSIYNKYKTLSSHIFRSDVNKPFILELYAKAKDASPKEKALMREKLYEHYKELYEILKSTLHVRQFHFHLPNNDSFLRMHKPERFGDNLTFIRDTVAYTNKFKKPIDGFEEGRIFNGFRFVYPMFYNNEHIGSVEISFSAYAIILDMIKDYNLASNLLINTEVVNTRVFDGERINYINSPIEGYSLDSEIMQKIDEKYKKSHSLSTQTISLIQKNIPLGKNTSIYDTNLKEIITILPLKNPISNSFTSAFISRSDATSILTSIKIFYMLVVSNILFLALILIALYIKINSEQKIKAQKEKILAIFNSQSIITIITDGVKIQDVNRAFFEFFTQFSSLESLQKEQNCICDLFEDIEEENYITHKDKENGAWLNTLLKTTSKERQKVCIVQDGGTHHFAISAQAVQYPNIEAEIDENYYVISLMDITNEVVMAQNINNIINFQDNMLVILDHNLELTYANKKFLSLFFAHSVEEFNKEFASFNEIFITHQEYFHSQDKTNWIYELIELDESRRIVSIVDEEDYSAKAFLINPTYIRESNSWICSFTEYTKLAIKAQTLSKRVYTDELTKIANRAKFNEEILREISFYKRYDTDFCIVLLDIDHFKKVNDIYGHSTGDEILVHLSNIVTKSIRNTDLFARWGGEEFVILLHQTTLEDTTQVVENLRKNIENTTFVKDIKITCSFGITQIKAEDTKESLFERADEALYEAKKTGRNRFCIKD